MEIKEVFKEQNVERVLEILEYYKHECKIIAGGTDVIIQIREGKVKPTVLIDISNIEELKEMKETDGWFEMGSGVTFSEIIKKFSLQDKWVALAKAASSVGSPQIRNTATIGGNICNASPAADFVPPLLALDAVVVLQSKKSVREMPLEEFIIEKGKVALEADEVLTKVKFRRLLESQGLGFSKLGFRKALAISKVCTAVFLDIDKDNRCKEIRIANGALGKYGLRERKIEDFLRTKLLAASTIHQGSIKLKEEIEKRLGGRSTVAFKKEAATGIFQKAVEEAFESCNIKGGLKE